MSKEQWFRAFERNLAENGWPDNPGRDDLYEQAAEQARKGATARRFGGRRVTSEAQCPHLEFHFNIEVARFEDTNIKYAEVTGKCLNCGGIACFRGMPFGCTPAHPTMAIDGSDANLPFMVGDEEYDGKAMGFAGRQTVP